MNTADDRPVPDCPFCSIDAGRIVLQSDLAVAVRDLYGVTDWHLLVIPRRHVPDYFSLTDAEIEACHRLLSEGRALVLAHDRTVIGFNLGINCGEAAGQTVMHAHIHLIPRRAGDNPHPRGGVRCVIPGKADYSVPG